MANTRLANNSNESIVRYGRIEEATARYSLGRSAMREIGKKANAVFKIGRCCMFDFEILDKYFDNMRKEQTNVSDCE